MEIKHTIEILTKDIQDIEKLVRNLQNSPKPAGIELDLAMSKLRNVYEVLLLIKEDTVPKIPDGASLIDERKEEPATLPGPEMAKGEKVEIEFEDNVAIQEVAAKDVTADKGVKKDAEILAEQFDQEASLNENLGSKRTGDVTSKLSSQPIDSISRNIGINDRFYIIRELFSGDSEGYNNLIQKLDGSTTFNDAFHFIEQRFPDTIEHEGVQILVNLSRRRFISSGNV